MITDSPPLSWLWYASSSFVSVPSPPAFPVIMTGTATASMAFTPLVTLGAVDQLAILCRTFAGPGGGSPNSFFMRVQWATDTSGSAWFDNTFFTAGAQTGSAATAVQPYAPAIIEYQIPMPVAVASYTTTIFIPVATRYMRLGVYSNGASTTTSYFTTTIERSLTVPTQN